MNTSRGLSGRRNPLLRRTCAALGSATLEERAAEAKRIQGHILASLAYRPLPPASEALEPRCAWKGASSFSRHPPDAAHAIGAEDKGLLKLANELWTIHLRTPHGQCQEKACNKPP
ncbi:hypothetical protein HPB48_004531 [Haemaphysalis longicornis]|uniref:Uncharacterized protein n=1 Tax=Haemaphysalis longicornis TaxID=44386 RepID=A0A9J6G034_HAELO|nr:hypothetical protein HPB48_004531 [Haemaphysalis longicornis]